MLAVGLLLLGTALLYVGAEAAIRGTTAFARAAGVPAFVLGALLFGIDLESAGTAIIAAGRGQTSIAAGEIFGTVLFLFSAAFGIALLLAREPVPAPEAGMVLAPALALVVTAVMLYDSFITRLEGAALVALYAGYVWLVIRHGRLARSRAEQLEREAGGAPRPRGLQIAMAVAGLALLYGGATLLLEGGRRILEATTLQAGFVGAAIVGVLASLDEVLLEVLPVRRGTPELATGNLLGTLAAFCSGVLGLAALVRPLAVDGAGALAFIGAAALYAVVATAFLWRGHAGRGVGVAVLAMYVVWLAGTAGI